MIKDLNKKIKAYALKNAISYKGKANSGAVLSALFNEGLEKSEVKDVMPKINEIISEISKFNLEEQQKEFEKLKKFTSEREHRIGLPELPNVSKSGVVMRYRPAPSGPMHVGHIISNLVSSLYVEKYGGKFYVIFDDTDPESIQKETYEKLKEDCNWIFGNVYEFLYSSSRIDLYYEYAKKLIETENAYICECGAEEFKENISKKIPCLCRKKSKDQNLLDWNKMLNKKGFKQGEAVLRFKTPEKYKGVNNSNPAMRDFPLARINEFVHPLQKNKYRVWPLMNLAVPVDDMELKMTHVIRGKDHKDNAKRQKMIFEVFNKEYPWTFFIGRIKFTDLVLSKRNISKLIEEGVYSGWDDEKLPTVTSLRKRKYTREAFSKFIEERGLTESDKVISAKDFFNVIDRNL